MQVAPPLCPGEWGWSWCWQRALPTPQGSSRVRYSHTSFRKVLILSLASSIRLASMKSLYLSESQICTQQAQQCCWEKSQCCPPTASLYLETGIKGLAGRLCACMGILMCRIQARTEGLQHNEGAGCREHGQRREQMEGSGQWMDRGRAGLHRLVQKDSWRGAGRGRMGERPPRGVVRLRDK